MKTADTTFCKEFVIAAKQGPRLYFAPLVGAIKAVREEAQRIYQINKSDQTLVPKKQD